MPTKTKAQAGERTQAPRFKRAPQFKHYGQIPVMNIGALLSQRLDDPKFNRKKGAIIAKRALFCAYGGGDMQENGPATCVTDLLADLRHFCDVIGEDFSTLDYHANDHYFAELRGDQ